MSGYLFRLMKTCDVNCARSHVIRGLHIHLGKMVVEISVSTCVKTKISMI